VLKYIPRLAQLHMHMNRLTDVRELCRKEFAPLETLDLGNNKIVEVPIALVYYLANLTLLNLQNNSVNHLPPWIGYHKRI